MGSIVKADYVTGEEIMDDINKAFEDGTYAAALHIYPHLNVFFENINALKAKVESIKTTTNGIPFSYDQVTPIRKLSHRVRDIMNDVIRSYNYMSISEIPSGLEMELLAYDMKRLDEALHIYEESESDNTESEDTTMENTNTIKETMQESINACTNNIKLDDLGPADDEPELDTKEKRLTKACDVICDIGLAITAASTIALAVKATKVKKATGKYNPAQLAGCMLDGYILGKNVSDVVLYMPNTLTSRVTKKLASATKKLASKAAKSIRKEVE